MRTNGIKNYQWGFSFVQLFAMNIMLLVWTIGLLIMWFQASRKIRRRCRRDVAGPHKAVIELAEAMQKESDFDLGLATEQHIKQQIAAADGGSISYSMSSNIEGSSETSFDWLKREKWWFSAMILFMFAASYLWIFVGIIITCAFIGPICGLIFALGVGTTFKSRIFFFAVWSLLGLTVSLSVSYGLPLEKEPDYYRIIW